MPKYTCTRCGYDTPLKSNFVKHLNRKTVCPPILQDVSMGIILKHNGLPMSTLVNPMSTLPAEITYDCDYCDATFKHRQTRSKHMKFHCKVKKNAEYKYKYDNLKEQMDQLLEKLLMCDESLALTNSTDNKITNTHDQSRNSHNTNIDNRIDNHIDNRTNNSVNNTQNNTQNLQINNYGEENTSFITKDKLKEILSNPYDSLSSIVNETHFNDDHPENNNLRIPNKKQPFIEVFKNNSWSLVGQYRFLCKMMEEQRDNLNDAFHNVKEELDAETRQRYLDYREQVDRDIFTYQSQLRELKATIIAGTRYK
jgi:hypothetical protein